MPSRPLGRPGLWLGAWSVGTPPLRPALLPTPPRTPWPPEHTAGGRAARGSAPGAHGLGCAHASLQCCRQNTSRGRELIPAACRAAQPPGFPRRPCIPGQPAIRTHPHAHTHTRAHTHTIGSEATGCWSPRPVNTACVHVRGCPLPLPPRAPAGRGPGVCGGPGFTWQ